MNARVEGRMDGWVDGWMQYKARQSAFSPLDTHTLTLTRLSPDAKLPVVYVINKSKMRVFCSELLPPPRDFFSSASRP